MEEVKMTLIERVQKVQEELKAPKNQFNKFGNYAYRSCEDVCNAVKPLLAKYGLVLTLSDEIVMVGERYYTKATATITDGIEKLYNTAYAREEESKKGMDGSQITGSSSSYARKYALNGLLLIDDVKDADATNTHGKKFVNDELTNGTWRSWIDNYFIAKDDMREKFCKKYNIASTDKLDTVKTLQEIDEIITNMKKAL